MTKRSHDFVHLPKKKNYMEEKKEEDKLSIPSIPSVNIPFLFFINQNSSQMKTKTIKS